MSDGKTKDGTRKRDGRDDVVDIITAALVAETKPAPRLCVVGPGRHSPVLGAMTEHVVSALSQEWTMSTVQVAVPGDPFDSTLVGAYAPELIRVPSLVESSAQSRLTRQRRLHRFFVRERPDVVMVDLWSMHQFGWLASTARSAKSAGARVVVRCCGRLDEHLGRLDQLRLRRTMHDVDLIVTQGELPHAFQNTSVALLALPEWRTEERQVDLNTTEVLAFLPSERSDEAAVLLHAFDGLSEERARDLSMVLAQRSGPQSAELESLVDSAHHRDRIVALTEWMSDAQLERRVSRSDVVLMFEPEADSRALDAASHQGVPVVIVRQSETGPGDSYSGATFAPFDPASVIASIERANLARRYRYPQIEDFAVGAHRLSERLYALVAHERAAV